MVRFIEEFLHIVTGPEPEQVLRQLRKSVRRLGTLFFMSCPQSGCKGLPKRFEQLGPEVIEKIRKKIFTLVADLADKAVMAENIAAASSANDSESDN